MIEWWHGHQALHLTELGAVMELADDLGIDELVERGAVYICRHIGKRNRLSLPVQRLIRSLSTPIRYTLLDHADCVSFNILRLYIPPYNHQYKRQLGAILPNSRFARCHDSQAIRASYETVLEVQKNFSALTINGPYDMEVHARVDKVGFSADGRYMFTLERVTHILVVWDLLPTPFEQVMVSGSIVDADFFHSCSIRALSTDGVVLDRSVSDDSFRTKSTIPSCSLVPAPSKAAKIRHHHSTAGGDPSGCFTDGPTVYTNLVALRVPSCVSPDGRLAICCDGRDVKIVPANADYGMSTRTLSNPHEADHELGDIICLSISADNSIVAAMYIGRVVFWFLDHSKEFQIFDLERRYSDTFGHVAFCPDPRFIALGSWEGWITVLQIRHGRFEVHSRTRLGQHVLHLEWYPDGQYLGVSSYVGVKIIQVMAGTDTPEVQNQ